MGIFVVILSIIEKSLLMQSFTELPVKAPAKPDHVGLDNGYGRGWKSAVSQGHMKFHVGLPSLAQMRQH